MISKTSCNDVIPARTLPTPSMRSVRILVPSAARLMVAASDFFRLSVRMVSSMCRSS